MKHRVVFVKRWLNVFDNALPGDILWWEGPNMWFMKLGPVGNVKPPVLVTSMIMNQRNTAWFMTVLDATGKQHNLPGRVNFTSFEMHVERLDEG